MMARMHAPTSSQRNQITIAVAVAVSVAVAVIFVCREKKIEVDKSIQLCIS